MSYAADWESAKTEFERITGLKKPKESKGVFNAFGSHTGLSSSLKECDSAFTLCSDTAADNAKAGPKAVKDFTAAFKKYQSAKKSYLAVLEKAIYDEVRSRPDPNTKSTYERALKALSKKLEALESTIDANLASCIQKFDAAAKSLGMKEKMVANWAKNMNAALARAAAGAAKVKADPTPKAYNDLFPKAARDITMQLVFARDLSGLNADPDVLKAKIDPWANQSSSAPPVRVPDTANGAQIAQLIKAFTVEVKRVKHMVDTHAS